MARFIINKRDLPENYIRDRWSYFLSKKDRTNGAVKIHIGKEHISVFIKEYYCVICNDLSYLYNKGKIQPGRRSLTWLKHYGYID